VRKLADWVACYTGYITPASESPLSYNFWSAATAVAAALKRNIFVGRGSYRLYPNLYTILVGRPGIGKGSAINPVVSIINEAKISNILSDRVTIEYALERMATGWQSIRRVGTGIHMGMDHTTLIISPEVSIFIGASQNTLPILADLWDAREGEFVYGTRHKGEFRIKDPCVCLLGGSTQEWLMSSIPANAVGGGFTRRVNFVVENDREKLLPWPTLSNHNAIRDNLVTDLREIARLSGEVKFHPRCVPLFEQCYIDSAPKDYDDEASTSYRTSMWAQITKLAMCMSASRGDDLVINEQDFKRAHDAVKNVMLNVPKVFRGVGESDLVVAADKVLRYLELKGFASRQELMKHLWRDVTSEDLDKILATFKEGAVVYDYQQGRQTLYAPVEKNPKKKGVTP
jgi:hypothetical protein